MAKRKDREPEREIPRERFIDGDGFEVEVDWPEARPEPEGEPTDHHLGPLDNPDDVRWLREDDPRRQEVEEMGYEGER